MRRTDKNIVYHELIGLNVVILDHTDRSLVNMSGKVVDETMNTLVIERGDRRFRIPKLGGRFLFKLLDEDVVVRGELLVGRPEDRIKRLGR